MISVVDLVRTFGARTVLDGLNLRIEAGKLNALIGPSGSGKSVLLKILAGTMKYDSGQVNLDTLANDDVSLMFQEGALFDSMSVLDNVAFPLVHGNVPLSRLPKSQGKWALSEVEEILARVGLTKAAHKFPCEISGGMRRRVSLARALVTRPKLLLLDDPTSGLDPVASSVIMNLIVEMQREYKPTAVVVSQDLRRLLPVAETIFALFNGRLAFKGSLTELSCCENGEVMRFIACRYDLHLDKADESTNCDNNFSGK